MKVAVIGLGNMGAAIARRIAQSGFDLTVYNRTASKAAPLVAAGARAADTIAAAVRDADVVVTSLMDDKSVLTVVEDHLLASMQAGAIHLGTTTVSPQCAERLASLHKAAGTRYLAAPVAGRPDAAEAGKLLSLVAGDREAAEAVRPVCLAYSASVNYLSEQHAVANTFKLCLNYTAVAIIETVGEIYAFGEKLGLDIVHLRNFLDAAMGSPALKTYVNKIFERDFDASAGFSMQGGLKDIQLMRDAAARAGASLEIGAIAERKMKAAIADGMGRLDWSATYEITRRESGLK